MKKLVPSLFYALLFLPGYLIAQDTSEPEKIEFDGTEGSSYFLFHSSQVHLMVAYDSEGTPVVYAKEGDQEFKPVADPYDLYRKTNHFFTTRINSDKQLFGVFTADEDHEGLMTYNLQNNSFGIVNSFQEREYFKIKRQSHPHDGKAFYFKASKFKGYDYVDDIFKYQDGSLTELTESYNLIDEYGWVENSFRGDYFHKAFDNIYISSTSKLWAVNAGNQVQEVQVNGETFTFERWLGGLRDGGSDVMLVTGKPEDEVGNNWNDYHVYSLSGSGVKKLHSFDTYYNLQPLSASVSNNYNNALYFFSYNSGADGSNELFRVFTSGMYERISFPELYDKPVSIQKLVLNDDTGMYFLSDVDEFDGSGDLWRYTITGITEDGENLYEWQYLDIKTTGIFKHGDRYFIGGTKYVEEEDFGIPKLVAYNGIYEYFMGNPYFNNEYNMLWKGRFEFDAMPRDLLYYQGDFYFNLEKRSTIGSDAYKLTLNQENNHAPVIENQTFTVRENSGYATVVGVVAASDPDDDPLSYSITDGNESFAFSLDYSTGELRVEDNTVLDYESNPVFYLSVEVSDGELTANALVTINLEDVEEGPNSSPVIMDQAFSVEENASGGTLVGTVDANDEDGDGLSFNLNGGNTGGAFILDASTGELKVSNPAAIDYSTTPSFRLNVEVSDGELSSAATITVTVLENENEGEDANTAPVISGQSFSVKEESENGSVIGIVSATDPEGDDLNYSIEGGNTESVFAIEATTGELFVADATGLDYQSTPEFALTVAVSDGEFTSRAKVSIIVLQAGTNTAPVIADQSFSIVEHSEEATVVGQVQAYDREGEVVNFRIVEGNTGEAFAIGLSNGQLRVNNVAMLDYETTPVYYLRVEATDGALTSSAIVSVEILDEDEQITGVKDEIKAAIKLYPNPVGSYLQLEVPASLKGGNMHLYNLNGNLLGSYALDALKQAIDISNLVAGMYYLQINKEGQMLSFKFIKMEDY